MPQAIKHFSGTPSDNQGTIYTCPANTIAMLIPSITMDSINGTRSMNLAWNRSSALTGDTQGNLRIVLPSSNSLTVIANNKYDVEIGFPANTSSSVKFVADGNQNPENGLYVNGSTTTATKTNAGAVSSSTFDVYRSFKTGPWIMSSGDVLSYYINIHNYLKFSYSFLIIEEPAG